MKFTKQEPAKFKRVLPIAVFALVVIIAVILIIMFLSRKGEKAGQQSQAAAPRERSPRPVIVRVDLDPAQPISIDFLRVVPVLKDPGMPYVKFNITWYVNGNEIPNSNDRLLDQQHYKKGDSVYCRVSAARGTWESKTINSPVVEIGNAPPVIDSVPVGQFSIPGRFHYQIKAHDPDGDSLSYYLVEPVLPDLHLNSDTGEISWDIREIPQPDSESTPLNPEDENAPSGKKPQAAAQPRLSSRVQIVFDVKDPDDGVTRGAITIDLTKGQEIPQ